MNLQLQGTITTWNDDKGFGFITPYAGGDRIFVHIKSFKQRRHRPQEKQTVYYSISKDKQGRPCATDVRYKGKQQVTPAHTTKAIAAYILTAVFFGILAGVTFVFQLIPLFIIGLYTLASAITFTAYSVDKSAAENGRWRTPEATLHMMSLLGGWPGALIAQQTLRHKSSKAAFQGVFKITVFLNIAVTAWLLTPQGPERTRAFLERILGS